MSALERIIRVLERDDVFYPLQILLLPAIVFLGACLWGGL